LSVSFREIYYLFRLLRKPYVPNSKVLWIILIFEDYLRIKPLHTIKKKKMEFIKKEVFRLARLINAPDETLPTFGTSEDFARPHIEKHGNEYHWVVVERGKELQRKKTSNLDEIIYWIFQSVTFQMAIKIELQNRIENEDFRIQLFKIQENLIGKINPKYKKILEEKHKKLLK